MSDFHTVAGFEEVWRPAVRTRARRPQTMLGGGAGGVRARLVRLVTRAPEVMVKVTGRTRDRAHLQAHLDYVTRNGTLEAEDQDGNRLGRRDVGDLVDDWGDALEAAPRRRRTTSLSRSIMLSMPAGTDPAVVRDAARAFALEAFGERFEHLLVLHTDTPRPHVHLAVCSRGAMGERLNPKKADLQAWREMFAEALRDRGVAAEATPRRARGVSRKAERTPLRKIRDRHEAGRGPPARTHRAALHEAAAAAFRGDVELRPWEAGLGRRRDVVRSRYLAQAELLSRSGDPADRRLAEAVRAFVRDLPSTDSRRLALARDLRAANAALARDRNPSDRERSR